MLKLKDYRDRAAALPDLLNYAAVIDPGVILNKDGSLTAGFYYRAQDISSSTNLERNVLAAKMNQLLTKLGTGWVIHTDASRIEISDYPDRAQLFFDDEISNLIDEERRTFFSSDNHYETIYTIILTYMPPNIGKAKVADMMFDEQNKIKNDIGDKTLKYFHSKLEEFESLASNIVFIHRMLPEIVEDSYNQQHTQEKLLEFINFALTGNKHPINLPPIPMYIDSYVGCQDFCGGVTPKIGDSFISVVAIDGFPQASVPNILDALGKLSIRYRWSTRFIFMDNFEAVGVLNKYRRKWNQKVKGWKEQLLNIPSNRVDSHALQMTSEIDGAITDINSGSLAYGYYSTNLVLMDKDRDNLDFHAKEVLRIITNLGFNGRIETVNAVEAWLGTLPGHVVQNVRRPLISTVNLVHFMPLSAIWAGDKYIPCDKFPPYSPALLYTTSSGSTPFRFNLHVGDVGHTLLFGPTGMGKSVLIATILAQFRKYKNAQVFAFDKDKSIYALTKALKGSHFDIGESKKNVEEDRVVSKATKHLEFAPLMNIKSDADQTWCEEWIETCLILQNFSVTPAHRKIIHEAMTLQREMGNTSLTDFTSNLQDEALRDALSYYTLAGTAGHLLDGEDDNFSLSKFTTFEIAKLMSLGEKIVIPVLLYLFKKIEEALDGSPTIISLDEAWIMFSHPVFKEKIREWLKVLRKKNCSIILATQNLSDAAKSGLMDVLLELCLTKIFLPNPFAFNKGTSETPGPYDYYRQFGLNETQIGIIADAIPKREYYYTSPLGTRLFNLSLGPIALSFVSISTPEQIAKCDVLMNLYGDNWPYKWLDERRVDYSTYKKSA